MNDYLLEEFENEYKDACNWLYTAARDAAKAKKVLIERWVTLHYPAIPCIVTILENENIFPLDVCFPDVDRETSTRIAGEMNDYLQALLDEKSV